MGILARWLLRQYCKLMLLIGKRNLSWRFQALAGPTVHLRWFYWFAQDHSLGQRFPIWQGAHPSEQKQHTPSDQGNWYLCELVFRLGALASPSTRTILQLSQTHLPAPMIKARVWECLPGRRFHSNKQYWSTHHPSLYVESRRGGFHCHAVVYFHWSSRQFCRIHQKAAQLRFLCATPQRKKTAISTNLICDHATIQSDFVGKERVFHCLKKSKNRKQNK